MEDNEYVYESKYVCYATDFHQSCSIGITFSHPDGNGFNLITEDPDEAYLFISEHCILPYCEVTREDKVCRQEEHCNVYRMQYEKIFRRKD